MLGIGLQVRGVDEVNWPNQGRFQLRDTIRFFFWEKNNNEMTDDFQAQEQKADEWNGRQGR
jgi:hypothetical protein